MPLPGSFASGKLATTAATSVYTVPSNVVIQVESSRVCNVSAAAVTVTVAVLPPGATDDGTTYVAAKSLSLPVGATVDGLLADQVLGGGEVLSLTASATNAVSYSFSGIRLA